MKTLRWGIIGLGRFGTIHAQTVQSLWGCELAAICNHNPDRLAQAQAQFPQATATTDYHRLLADDSLDIVTVATHWQQHFEVANQALLSGRHVFLEKPMATSSEQCLKLIQTARQSPGQLMVGHVCRFDPRVSLAKEAVLAGRIGRIVSMHAKRNLPRAPGHIRLDKISPLMGDGIHDADIMLWMMQCLPSKIYAKTVRCSDYQYPDLGWAMLEFQDQAVGVIETNWCLPESVPTVIDARMEIVGTDGMLTIDCSQTGLQLTNAAGSKMSDTVYWPQQYGHRIGALHNQLAYFADCVRYNTPVTVITAQEAANAVLVMEAAEMSAASGRPVDLC